jgi:tetratricopeptide (TPR) repeat protein
VSLEQGSSGEPLLSFPAASTLTPPSRSILCVTLLVLAIAAYWPTFSNGFVNYDDPRYVLQNPLVAKGLTLSNIAFAFRTTMEANWHPITWISHMADVQFFGLQPAGHHASSLFLHCLNVLFLFLLLDSATGFRWRSALVAALFAVHPLNVECVAWISERKSLLSTTFLLLAFFAYGWYVKKPGISRYLPVVALFALGLASKPMVITFPFLLLLLDYWPLNRLPVPSTGKSEDSFLGKLGELSMEKAPLFLLGIASGWITLYAQRESGAVATSAGLPLVQRIPNAIYSYLLYILKGLWPIRLAVFYPHPENSLAPSKPIVAALFLIAVTYFVWLHREKRYLVTGWLWYLGTLVPVIGVIQVGRQALADRYAYLPFLGLFVMIVWSVVEMLPRLSQASKLAVPVSAIILLWFAALTWWQTTFWRDSGSLFSRTLAVTQNNYLAENNLGMAYSAAGQAQSAFEHFREAVRLRPKFSTAHYNLGLSLRAQDNLPAAQAEFELAIQYANDPVELAQAHHNLGIAFYEQHQLAAARRELSAALALAPDKENSLLARGMTEFELNDFPAAGADFQRASAIRPTPQAIFWIGRTREARGDFNGAVAAYQETLHISPSFHEAQDRLDAIQSGKNLMFMRIPDSAVRK